MTYRSQDRCQEEKYASVFKPLTDLPEEDFDQP